jgi:porin
MFTKEAGELKRIFDLRFLLVLFVLAGITKLSLAQEQHPEATTNSRNNNTVPEVGGPGSVGYDINEIQKERETESRMPWLDLGLKPWFDFKESIADKYGLTHSMDYQALYQAVNTSPGADDAASGILRLYGSWTLSGSGTKDSGSLVYKVDNRHLLGTEIAPQSLGFQAGSTLPTGTMFNQFSDSNWGLTNFYWLQRLNEGKASFIIGRVDVTDYVDIYALINPLTSFTNLAFSTNPTIAAPSQGFGGAAGSMLGDKAYIFGGFGDANGDPTDDGFDTFFDENEYFSHLEIGVTPDFERRYLDNMHITAWHVDKRKKAQVPDGWGVTFSATKFINDKWIPFFRAGYADGDAPLLQATASTGIGYYFPKRRDLLGVGVNWGKPSINELNDQYTAEMFYRLQLSQNLAITPDVQLIINPALNPDENAIVVFGIRGRMTF